MRCDQTATATGSRFKYASREIFKYGQQNYCEHSDAKIFVNYFIVLRGALRNTVITRRRKNVFVHALCRVFVLNAHARSTVKIVSRAPVAERTAGSGEKTRVGPRVKYKSKSFGQLDSGATYSTQRVDLFFTRDRRRADLRAPARSKRGKKKKEIPPSPFRSTAQHFRENAYRCFQERRMIVTYSHPFTRRTAV